MEIQEIATFIGSLGFPIVACGALFWFINNTVKELKQTLQNNTDVITKLITKLDKGDLYGNTEQN